MRKAYNILAGIFALLCLPGIGYGQIPNAGFENWTNDTLDGWWINNVAPLYTTVTQSTNAHSGSIAIRGEVVAFYTNVAPPTIQSGVNGRGFAYSQRPLSFTGYYKFFPAAGSGDRFGVNVGLYTGGVDGTHIGIAAAVRSDTVSSYTEFTTSFNYSSADRPDTCVIQFQIVGPGTGADATPHVGSYFLLDDVAFTGVSGVADRKLSGPTVFELKQNYPNPFNPTTNVSFTVPSNGTATLTVFNLLGQQVATLFDGPVSSGKLYRATFSASGLPSGVYFSRLSFVPAGSSSGSMELMRKMTLIK
jgi:hypothetical protein